MFGATPIRYLSRSEEIFATGRNFIGLTLYVTGTVDVAALTRAFDALLQTHPVLAGHLEPGGDGRHQIVVDDYGHPGIWVEKPDQTALQRLPDQAVALVNVRLRQLPERAEVTLYTHHALADAHHQFALVEELFGHYTDIVGGHQVAGVQAVPVPQSLEEVLAQRAITKLPRSGLERFMPAVLAHELPPSKRNPGGGAPLPVRVPSARHRFSAEETRALLGIAGEHRVSVNSLVAAAILIAEWRVRGTPHIPIPYVYPVNLRYFLSPPVAATEATNPLGVATYLAQIGPGTEVVGLARDITDAFRTDLADGVIAQSLLHFALQYEGNPPGLPDIVMTTDSGEMPPLRTPSGVSVDGYHSEVLFASASGFDMYACGTFAGALLVEYHTHAADRDRYVDELRDLLRALPAQYSWAGD